MQPENPAKILVFSTNGVKNDGITSWFLQYFSHMDRTGIDVHTIVFEGTSADLLERLDQLQITTHTLPSRQRHPLRYMRALRRVVRSNSYDVVHVNGNSGTVAIDLLSTALTGAKTRIVHSRNTQGSFPTYDRVLRPVMNALCTERLACGRDAGRWLFGPASFTVIPNGKDFANYAFDDAVRTGLRRELGLSSDTVAVGHVGNFTEQKNHRFLVAAFAVARQKNADLQLFLIGDGELRPEIEKLVANLGLTDSVHFVGRTTDVNSYLSAFDVAVLPSNHEGFPNVVIEWQISGLPSFVSSAVTDECGITDLVSFLPPNDVQAWAEALANVHQTEREAMASSAQRKLKLAGYDVRDGAAKLRSVYDRLIQRSI